MPQLSRFRHLVFARRSSFEATIVLTAVTLLVAGCIRPYASASSMPAEPADTASSSIDTSSPVLTSGRVSGTVREIAGTRVLRRRDAVRALAKQPDHSIHTGGRRRPAPGAIRGDHFEPPG